MCFARRSAASVCVMELRQWTIDICAIVDTKRNSVCSEIPVPAVRLDGQVEW